MKTILIADDDRLARGALRRALEDAGYQTKEAENGADALKLAEADKPDMIITDRQMPEMGGQELLEAVRATEWGKGMPIIMLTANENTEAINLALKSGVTAYFTKTEPLSAIVEAATESI